MAETGLYGDRGFRGATPFVYVPSGHQWWGIDHPKAAYEGAAVRSG